MKEMNYEEFLNVVTEEARELMTDSFNIGRDFYCQIASSSVEDATVFVLVDNKSYECIESPVIEDLYENYQNTGHIRGCMIDMLENFYNSDAARQKFEAGNFEKWKSHVIISVINYDRNEEFLRTVPHFRFLDLAVVFRVVVEIKEGYLMSFILTNEYFSKWKISMDKLLELAKENTKEIVPIQVSYVNDVLADSKRRALLKQGVSLQVANLEAMLYRESLKDDPMLVMTNMYATFGASALFLEELFDKSFETDILIAPSSIHELIILPNDKKAMEFLSITVPNINRSRLLQPHEFLSDHIYLFGKKEKMIKIIR